MNLPLRRTLVCSVLAALIPQSIPGETQIDAHNFSLPDGFTIQRVAASPLVDRPIVADFDEAGRLYVADSSGSNDPVEKQLAEKPHRIVRLEDVDGDGIFDKSIVFADKMMFPAGAMWLKDSLYVSAPPSIWKLTDTDGDGVADQREEWFQGKTLTGCANDLHGPYLGPDGWIYWCKGAFAKQTHERPGQEPFTTRAAHIFRARPDGTGLEAVMTGGMDNPVDVVFTPEGERIFTTTFFQHPGGGQRDGLVHAIYGGVYGKSHDVLDDHPRTGELMPVLTHLGPAAPSGLVRYESEGFGDDYRNNLFAANFNLRKVSRHVLIPKEAGFQTENSDFLVSDNSDFHPTDVIEDADGSLLIIDTGGWYKLCCPTSQLWKPDVLGAIYRVRREGSGRASDPRGMKIDWNDISPGKLVTLLGDRTRPAVQKRAIHLLAESSAETLSRVFGELGKSETNSPDARRNAIWALARLESAEAGRLVSSALQDKDPSVVHAAIHVASVTRNIQALDGLVALLQSDDAPLKRAAAEALGRLGEIKAVHPLLDAAGRLRREGPEVRDRNLEHSIIYALIEINSPKATRAGFLSSNALVVRAAAIALDQMKAGDYTATEALDLLSSGNSFLKPTGNWIISQHQDWGASLAEYYGLRLAIPDLTEGERGELQHQLANSISAIEVQELLGRAITNKSLPLSNRSLALQAITQSALKTIPASWASGLDTLITERDSELLPEIIRAIASFDPKQLPAGVRKHLQGISRNDEFNSETRLEALASASPGGPLDEGLFEFVYSNLEAGSPAVGKILSQFEFSEEQLLQLTDPIRSAGPLQISSLLAPFAHSKSERVGITLIKALGASKGLSGLHSDRLKQLFANYPDRVQKEAAGLIESLNEDAAAQSAHLNAMVEKLQEGDVRRGQALFNSSKTACSSCHAIGYLGGDLGPDLTRIGQVRNERDLLEAVLFPSASFVRSYEPMIVSTRDGEEYSGIVRKNAPDEIVLATGPNVEVRIAAADVLGMRPGKISVMPQGLDQQLSTSELADLIAFLKATRW